MHGLLKQYTMRKKYFSSKHFFLFECFFIKLIKDKKLIVVLFFNLIVGIDLLKCGYTGLIGGTVSGYVLSVILLVALAIQNVWILYHKRR